MEFLNHCFNKNSSIADIKSEAEKKKENDGTNLSIGDFEIMKMLGHGGYGHVYLTKKLTAGMQGEPFALKVIAKNTLLIKENERKYAINERNILKSIDSPHVVKLFFTFSDIEFLFFGMEFLAGGELYSLMERRENLSETESRFYLAELVLALQHIHTAGVIYRDLKPENVMLDREGHVKVTDFGLSKLLIGGATTTKTYCGTVDYMAPEVICSQFYGFGVDWWSLGVLMYDMLYTGSPFAAESRKELKRRIVCEPLRLPHENTLSRDGRAFLRQLLVKDPQKRLGATKDAIDLREHRFFSQHLDWTQLENRQIAPPFPKQSSLDNDNKHGDDDDKICDNSSNYMFSKFEVSCFDPEILSESIELCSFQPTKVNFEENGAFDDFGYVCADMLTEDRSSSDKQPMEFSAHLSTYEYDNEKVESDLESDPVPKSAQATTRPIRIIFDSECHDTVTSASAIAVRS